MFELYIASSVAGRPQDEADDKPRFTLFKCDSISSHWSHACDTGVCSLDNEVLKGF